MTDWSVGNYERTAAELEPVAVEMVRRAAPAAGERVVDLACGTGNAALLAAAAGAQVVAVDSASRLLEVGRERARAAGATIEFRDGDLLDVPVGDGEAELVLSVFGVIFAPDPARGMAEVARMLAPSGRALISAWIPAGPIAAMLGAFGRVLGEVTGQSPPARFGWSGADTVGALARGAGLSLERSAHAELAIRDRSPEAYVAAGEQHPMALAAWPALATAGADERARAAMLMALRAGNEDPDGLLIHSPYVIHELRAPA